jgi:hypothetical protein
MRFPLLFSFGFHLAIFFFAIYGLPSTTREIVMEQRVIDVEIIAEEPERKAAPKPKPAPPARTPPPPPPKPEPTPPEQVAALPPEPEPALPPEPKPKPIKAEPEPPKPVPPKPAPKAAQKPKPAPPKVAPRPKVRPKPDFASMMLKTVEKLEAAPPEKPEEPKKKEKTFEEKMAALINKKLAPKEQATPTPLGQRLTGSEMDAIRRQIESCWNMSTAIGAKEVEKMTVQIQMKLNQDGLVRESRIVDQFRANTDRVYRVVAESALRAVRNPRCNQFRFLTLDKYDLWKNMTLTFRPSEMVGR